MPNCIECQNAKLDHCRGCRTLLLGQLQCHPDVIILNPYLKIYTGCQLRKRILLKVLLLVDKSKNSLAPEYLSSLCIPYRKDFNPKSNHLDLRDPGPKSRMKPYGDRSFKKAGAEEWNKLPLPLKRSSSVELFTKTF